MSDQYRLMQLKDERLLHRHIQTVLNRIVNSFLSKQRLVQSLPLILAIVLLLYSINNIYTFLVVKKATFLSLFVWNTCTPVSIATAAVLLFGKEMRVLSSSMVPLLLWFGFLGLFVFWWGWLDLQLAFLMQGQHLVMTVTAVCLVKTRWTKKGAFVGVVALLPLIASFRVLGPYAAPLWSQARLGLGTEAERYA